MPWTTVAVVFGSWVLLLILTLSYFLEWSHKRGWDDEEPEQ